MNKTKQERIENLALWGDRIREKLRKGELYPVLTEAYLKNPWFIEIDTEHAINNICREFLEEQKLENWLSDFPEGESRKKVGLIMAGNLPLVGFHDLLSVLASGNDAVVKLSSKDKVLLPELIEILKNIDKDLAERVNFTEQISNIDAIIATGSDNSARYFEYYFGKYPNIIRKNRTSVAILDGNESEHQIFDLEEDLFRYFGLGCRNVSHLLLPEAYDFNRLLEHFSNHDELNEHTKYMNNYGYYKSIMLMNREEHLDSGNCLLKKSEQVHSPMSVIHYQNYTNKAEIEAFLNSNNEKIQCVLSDNVELNKNTLKFGEAQKPSLTDYPDNVDLLKFLESLKD